MVKLTPEQEEAYEKLVKDGEMYAGRHLDTELALWTAILTLNGLAVSASSVLIALTSGYWRVGFLGSIVLSLWSSILIFRNFAHRRYLYACLKASPSKEVFSDDEKFNEYFTAVEETKKYHRAHEEANRTRENFAISFMASSCLCCVGTVILRAVVSKLAQHAHLFCSG